MPVLLAIVVFTNRFRDGVVDCNYHFYCMIVSICGSLTSLWLFDTVAIRFCIKQLQKKLYFMFSLAPLDRFSCKICDKTIITRRWLRYVGYLPSQFRLSVVCNVRAHYSAGWDFRQHFHAILYISHRPTFVQNYTKIVPGEPLRRVLNARVVPKCI